MTNDDDDQPYEEPGWGGLAVILAPFMWVWRKFIDKTEAD
jgi:hypothetical protein